MNTSDVSGQESPSAPAERTQTQTGIGSFAGRLEWIDQNSPMVTVNTEPVAWVESPMLLRRQERDWIMQVRYPERYGR